MTLIYLDQHNTSDVMGAFRMGPDQLAMAAGRNFGNLVFRHALRFILQGLDDYRPLRWPEAEARAATGDRVDRVILSAANWLGLTRRDEDTNAARAGIIEALDAPIVCFGLGLQAPLGSGRVTLGPQTLRFARALAERTEVLSLRDDLTADTLVAHGIDNVVVTGCPSLFISDSRDLGAQVTARAQALVLAAPQWGDLRTCLSEVSGGHPGSAEILRTCLRMMADAPAFYIAQSPALLPFLLREAADPAPFYARNHPFDDPTMLARVLRRGALHFSSVPAWLDFARTCHVATGMRVHGSVVALLAGVPTVMVAHDARTAGLAQVMGLPVCDPAEFPALVARGPAAIAARAITGLAGFDARRQQLAATTVDFVRRNGLVPHGALTALAKAA